jgi:hypothetical protein
LLRRSPTSPSSSETLAFPGPLATRLLSTQQCPRM